MFGISEIIKYPEYMMHSNLCIRTFDTFELLSHSSLWIRSFVTLVHFTFELMTLRTFGIRTYDCRSFEIQPGIHLCNYDILNDPVFYFLLHLH